MNNYEQILNKISHIFYKFVSYSHYFNLLYFEKKSPLVLQGFVNYDYKTESYYLSKKVSYSLLIKYRLVSHDRPYVWYYIISLSKSNGFMVDFIYGFTGFITTMVINNFSFENKKIVDKIMPLYLSFPAKDLFIRLVGINTYETIRRNIK